jgi:Dullard-like phosphatase family protein
MRMSVTIILLVLVGSLVLMNRPPKQPEPDTARGRSKRRTVLVLDIDETLVHYDPVTNAILVRPHVKEFLKTADKNFDELVVFTAAMQEYADQVMEHIERITGVRVPRRYYRDSCTPTDGAMVKDLRIIGENPDARVWIVDNTPSSYMLQPQCGVPIASYIAEDPNDTALLDVLVVLLNKL